MPYFLPDGYVERLGAPQSYDEGGDATWQREVYATARVLADVLGLQTVIDFGCGAGVKLVQYFGDRGKYVLGVDLAPAVERLKRNYPDHKWCTPTDMPFHLTRPDLLICADVLEHLDNPNDLLEAFKRRKPKWLVLSTPDRKLMEKYPKWGRRLGPPSNGCHVREWAFDEFEKYIGEHMEIVRHWISNREQCTQAIIARLW